MDNLKKEAGMDLKEVKLNRENVRVSNKNVFSKQYQSISSRFGEALNDEFSTDKLTRKNTAANRLFKNELNESFAISRSSGSKSLDCLLPSIISKISSHREFSGKALMKFIATNNAVPVSMKKASVVKAALAWATAKGDLKQVSGCGLNGSFKILKGGSLDKMRKRCDSTAYFLRNIN